MLSIDWIHQWPIVVLAIAGMFLIALSLEIRYLSAKRGNILVFLVGIVGGLALGLAGGLYFVPATPDWFENAAEWYTVERGEVVLADVRFGDVEPADVTYMSVKLHSRTPGAAAGVIRWVIDDGTMVKKGDRLVEFDDSEWQKELKEKPTTPERRKYLEEQIANCKIFAPRDGLAIYYIERRHMGPGPVTWVPEAGEQVKEGQKLLTIFDPAKMLVQTHFPESQIGRIRLGHPARIRIAALGDRIVFGRVSVISKKGEWTAPDSGRKMFPVWVTLTDPEAGLLPEMGAKVDIDLERRDHVLRVPPQMVLHGDGKFFCYVKSGHRIRNREVTVGLRTPQFVEISTGLEEGEQVLADATWQLLLVPSNERQ